MTRLVTPASRQCEAHVAAADAVEQVRLVDQVLGNDMSDAARALGFAAADQHLRPRIVRRSLSNSDGQTIRLAISVSSSSVMNMTPFRLVSSLRVFRIMSGKLRFDAPIVLR
jgi:hypothetical protein